jgi:hypothetical protein
VAELQTTGLAKTLIELNEQSQPSPRALRPKIRPRFDRKRRGIAQKQAVPASKEPKSRTSIDGQIWLRHFAQDCITTAQAGLLMAQVKPASVRSGNGTGTW